MSDVIKTSLLFAFVLLLILPPGAFAAQESAAAAVSASEQARTPQGKITAGSNTAGTAVKRPPAPPKAAEGWSAATEPVYEFHSEEGGYRLHEDSQHRIITVGGDPHHGIYRNPSEDYAPQGFRPSYKCAGIDDKDCTDTWVDRRQWYENQGRPSR